MPLEEKNEKQAIEAFQALSAEEKTKQSGMRYLSEEEIAERTKKSNEIVTELFKNLLSDILASEKLVVTNDKSDDEKEVTFGKPLNNLYSNLVNSGGTYEDLVALQRVVFWLGKKLDVILNSYNIDIQKFMYQITGENTLDATPINVIKTVTKTLKEQKDK